mmetsp:Transcript_28440/g.46226  ORF Transcript_28440/g.46226 Transcript_28440/m.46226 type:complete len:374 (+) Transcript_28440:215-1336(+)
MGTSTQKSNEEKKKENGIALKRADSDSSLPPVLEEEAPVDQVLASNAYEHFLFTYYDRKDRAKFMFHPFSVWRHLISVAGVLIFAAHFILFISAMYVNFRCSQQYTCELTLFSEGQPGDVLFDRVELTLQLFCLFELLVKFRTGFCKETGEIEMRWQVVGRRYLLSWFLIDLLVAVPWFRLFPDPIAPDAAPRRLHERLLKPMVSAAENTYIVKVVKTAQEVRRQPPPPPFVAYIKGLVAAWAAAHAEYVKGLVHKAIDNGALRLLPYFGAFLCEKRNITLFIKTFLFSTKIFILVVVVVKAVNEQVERRERRRNEAATVIARAVRRYLARKKAKKLAMEQASKKSPKKEHQGFIQKLTSPRKSTPPKNTASK